MRARSVTRPRRSSTRTMLFMLACSCLKEEVAWAGGHDSIMVPTRPVRAWMRACFSVPSGSARARCRAPFTSLTRAVWVSGEWLAEARAATNTLARAGLSLSPAFWHWGSRWSSMKPRALISSGTNSVCPAAYTWSATIRAHGAYDRTSSARSRHTADLGSRGWLLSSLGPGVPPRDPVDPGPALSLAAAPPSSTPAGSKVGTGSSSWASRSLALPSRTRSAPGTPPLPPAPLADGLAPPASDRDPATASMAPASCGGGVGGSGVGSTLRRSLITWATTPPTGGGEDGALAATYFRIWTALALV
uniref:Secreted protein n=1 Tax=Ixodes ricinus TaxID=34613 RepID=A0A6B0V8C6_IXORI